MKQAKLATRPNPPNVEQPLVKKKIEKLQTYDLSFFVSSVFWLTLAMMDPKISKNSNQFWTLSQC